MRRERRETATLFKAKPYFLPYWTARCTRDVHCLFTLTQTTLWYCLKATVNEHTLHTACVCSGSALAQGSSIVYASKLIERRATKPTPWRCGRGIVQ